ncbi:MAG: diguanylate cyclase, partial [Terracidiphilus sp.]
FQLSALDPAAPPRSVKILDSLPENARRMEAGCAGPDGADWLLAGNRLARLSGGAWSMPPIDGFERLDGTLLALACSSDGALWLTGEQAGVWRLRLDRGRLGATRIELPPELRSLSNLAILADRRGWIWIGTDSGLVVWNGKEWRHLTEESGLIWNDVNQWGLREGADGTLWIGTSGGVAHLLHPENAFAPVPIGVTLTKLERAGASFLGWPRVELPWSGPPLKTHISSPTTRNRSELVLRVHMEGLRPDWFDVGNGEADFATLGPGNYTFRAMACNPALGACSSEVHVDIRILPPWWRRTWFYVLCGLGALCLMAGFDRLRVRQMRQRSRRLENLVLERTRELELSREQLRIRAMHDGLTGMLNREAILQALEEEMERARRERGTVIVVLADLDHFKRVNDVRGHLAGDQVLRQFADAVSRAIRSYDHAGRYGGEEFLMILTQVPPERVEERLASLHADITNLKINTNGGELRLHCSLGATLWSPASWPASVESLLATADAALYAAKAAGRNRVVFRPLEEFQDDPSQSRPPMFSDPSGTD